MEDSRDDTVAKKRGTTPFDKCETPENENSKSDDNSSFQQIPSKCFRSKCDNPYCQGKLHTIDSDGEILQQCPICLEDLDNKEITLLNECNHICCATCNERWQDWLKM